MNRIEPNMPVTAYKTYGLVAPPETHFRKATCQEIECSAFLHGWTTMIDVATELGRNQANYIRLMSGREFTVDQIGTLVTFTFPAEQKCFADHKVALERDPHFYMFNGDWRGRLSDVVERSPGDWLDDFAMHQDRLKTQIERG